MCKNCTCDTKQDLIRCNCVKLHRIFTVDENNIAYTSKKEFKSVNDFIRFCDLNNINHNKFKVVQILEG